jgi:hypothetical protein
MDAQGALKIAGIASVRFPAFKTTDASRWPRCAMTSTIGENPREKPLFALSRHVPS